MVRCTCIVQEHGKLGRLERDLVQTKRPMSCIHLFARAKSQWFSGLVRFNSRWYAGISLAKVFLAVKRFGNSIWLSELFVYTYLKADSEWFLILFVFLFVRLRSDSKLIRARPVWNLLVQFSNSFDISKTDELVIWYRHFGCRKDWMNKTEDGFTAAYFLVFCFCIHVPVLTWWTRTTDNSSDDR